MRYRRLGRSGMQVSEIGFGAWTIALDWWGRRIDREEAHRMLTKAHDVGITLYETADMYGMGKSETLMGESLGGVRDDIVISTKYGYDYINAQQVGHTELPQRFDPEYTRKALDMSLERLRTNRVDLYGLHNPKIHHIHDRATFEFLNKLISEQSVGALQVALGPAIGWLEEGVEAMSKDGVTAVQTVYNILEQTPGNELMQKAHESDVSILVRVPDASGILTGKVTADTKMSKNDHRRDRKAEWRAEALKKVEQLRPIADSNGLSIPELAIKFILSKESVGSVIPTVVSVDEIVTFADMSDGHTLDASDMDEISEIYSSWPPYKLKSSMA